MSGARPEHANELHAILIMIIVWHQFRARKI